MLYDVIVIGGGPGGYTAALYAARANLSVAILEKLSPGGQMGTTDVIDNYPGFPQGVNGFELAMQMKEGAERFGAQTQLAEVTQVELAGQVKTVHTSGGDYQARTVVLATGAHPRELGLPGERELRGRGVSYCATCDGMFYRGKQVVVAGDAPDLAEETEYLRSIGCEVTSVRLPGLHILGEDQVTGVRTAKGEEIPCQGVFLLRASIAPTQLAPGLELDGNYVKVNSFMATNLPGIYAAGDCTGQPLQLAKAVGEGQIAAHHALGL